MKSDGYLNSDNKIYDKSYYLSNIGRCFAICILLDCISFQSLCILSQVYCKTKKDPTNKINCYMISKFRDIFDKSHDKDMACASAIYSNSNVLKSIKQLTDRNLIYWINSDFLRISLPIFENLQKNMIKILYPLSPSL